MDAFAGRETAGDRAPDVHLTPRFDVHLDAAQRRVVEAAMQPVATSKSVPSSALTWRVR